MLPEVNHLTYAPISNAPAMKCAASVNAQAGPSFEGVSYFFHSSRHAAADNNPAHPASRPLAGIIPQNIPTGMDEKAAAVIAAYKILDLFLPSLTTRLFFPASLSAL